MLAAICGVDRQDKHDDHELIPRIIEINDVGIGQRDNFFTDRPAQLAVAEDLIIPAEQIAFYAPAFAVDAVARMQKGKFLRMTATKSPSSSTSKVGRKWNNFSRTKPISCSSTSNTRRTRQR